jgi:beta-glucanase (GH16 family)
MPRQTARKFPRGRARWLASAIATCGIVTVSACGPDSVGSSAVHAAAPSVASSLSPVRPPSAFAGNPGPGWTLTWQDDFTGSGALRRWTFLNGGNGWGNKELQNNDSRNVSLAPGGGLVITAARTGYGQRCWYGPCTYSAARLQTEGTFAQEYGLFEARIKLPTGTGLWPAFWMEGADMPQVNWPAAGEIDVVEVNNKKPDLVEAFAHAPDESYGAYYHLPNSLSAGYHVYGINWTARGITWLVDGHVYGHMNAYAGWPFDQPFFLILSLAVGGTWPGSPTSGTPFPAHMDVSWIRVYRQKA